MGRAWDELTWLVASVSAEARRAIVRLKGRGDVLLTGPFDLTHPDVL